MVSTPPGALERALKANHKYASGRPSPQRSWAPQMALVLCMDARLDPVQFLGLQYGEAHIIRNAGGRMAEAIRSLAISQALLGTAEVAVIHHTECALLGLTENEIRARVQRERGTTRVLPDFLPIADLKDSIREDLTLYRSTPFVRQDIPVRGFILDIQSGRLTEVT